MTYLRVKSTRGREYLYLVETRWDAKLGHPRQRVLKYLGPLERVRAEDLPARHLTPKLRASLARLQESQRVRRAPAEIERAEAFLSAILAGDLRRARRVAQQAVRVGGLDAFYGRTLPEVFGRIGEGWEAGQYSVPQEHLATGVAAQVIAHLTNALPPPEIGAPEILLTVPEGESHAMPLALAEGLLIQRGYRPLNLGATAPTSAVVAFAKERQPSAVLISVTEPKLLGAARTLGARVKAASPHSRIAIGGQAVARLPPRPPEGGVAMITQALPEFIGEWSSSEGVRSTARTGVARTGRARSRPGGAG